MQEYNNKEITYIATISGGKDSVAMCDLLLKNGYPVDYIIFNDTLGEFEEMYNYLEDIKKHFYNKYGKKIITTTPIRSFKDAILTTVKRSKKESRNGQFVGIPVPIKGDAQCHLRKTLKINPFEKWIRKNIKGDYKIYKGYTTKEIKRLPKEKKNDIYPLIEYFNMSERDCLKYLKEQGLENILYKYFNRTGCELCPYKTRDDWENIYHYFRDTWEKAKEIEKELQKKQKEYCYFFGNKPLEEWEVSFNQGRLVEPKDL